MGQALRSGGANTLSNSFCSFTFILKISASIYSNKTKSLRELVQELDAVNIDYIHIDSNNELGVFNDIEQIRPISNAKIDLHIISPEPEKFFDGIRKTNTEYVTFQYEDLKTTFDVPSDISSKLGLAIVSNTPVDVFENYKNRFDFILFMTTTPGQSGGAFSKETFQKIREFKKKYPDKTIHVDGGVTDEVAFVLRNMGVFLVVSGSYLVNPYDTIGSAVQRLRSDRGSSHILMSDFMITKKETPIVGPDASFLKVLQNIESYNFGFTSVVDHDGKLIGIVSNADVRRGLIKNMQQFDKIGVNELINKAPYKIKSTNNVSEMLNFIRNIKTTILFLPVVDDDNVLQGVVTFNNLIKNE